MKLLEHKPIQDAYIVFFNDNQAEQNREFQDFDEAFSFIRSIKKDFKSLASIGNGEVIKTYKNIKEVTERWFIHCQLKEQEELNKLMQPIREFFAYKP